MPKPMPGFSNKIVLVTGGSRGIGRAIIEAFAREGAKVAIGHSGRTDKDVRELVAAIGSDRAIAVAGDLADAQAVVDIVEQTVKHFGRIDVLVNNAGICPFTD